MAFTSTQAAALAIIPKFSSSLSIISDLLVLLEILYLQRSKLERVYNRIILSMAMYDLSVASAKFFSTWPIPQESSVAFASGNYQTCQAQGFFLQFGIGAVVTNCCLSCYFLLVIRFSWTETQIRRRAEPLFYAVSFVIAAGTAIASYFLTLYNPASLWCWLAAEPKGCDESFNSGGQTTCIRGDNASLYRWVFYYALIWGTIIFATFVMVTLYMSFRKAERDTQKRFLGGWVHYIPGSRRFLQHSRHGTGGAKHDTDGAKDSKIAAAKKSLSRSTKKKHLRSHKIAMQGICFVGAFYLTWLFATVNRINQLVTGNSVYWMAVMHAILSPSQGFWNYLVYLRPRYLKSREDNPEASLWTAFRSIMYTKYKKYSKSTKSTRVESVESGSNKREATGRISQRTRMLLGKDIEESKEEVDYTEQGETVSTVSFAKNIEEADRSPPESPDPELSQAGAMPDDGSDDDDDEEDDEASIRSDTLL